MIIPIRCYLFDLRGIMKILIKTCFYLWLFTMLSSNTEVKEWRGIVPLQSTRNDVIRILGRSSDSNSLRANYTFEKEDVYIVFAAKDDSRDCVKRLPVDSVLLIQVTLKYDLLLSDFTSDLDIDLSKFRKFDPASPPDIGYEGYVNEREGLVIRTFKGKVDQVIYISTSNDKCLCPELYKKPEELVQIVIG